MSRYQIEIRNEAVAHLEHTAGVLGTDIIGALAHAVRWYKFLQEEEIAGKRIQIHDPEANTMQQLTLGHDSFALWEIELNN